MRLDLKKRRALLSLCARSYSRQGLRAAALALDGRAEVLLAKEGNFFEVELRPCGRADRDALFELAGEFANEALSHDCRQRLVRLNAAASSALLARALSEGLRPAPADPLEELEPQVKRDRQADLSALLDEARRGGA